MRILHWNVSSKTLKQVAPTEDPSSQPCIKVLNNMVHHSAYLKFCNLKLDY